MSDTITSSGQTHGRNANVPRALIHKKILDVAASRPSAPMETIANEVSGATTSIVEKVLEEYGDPGTAPDDDSDDEREDVPEPEQHEANSVDSGTDHDPTMNEPERQSTTRLDLAIEPADVTEKQLETLQEIYEHPDATQAALADALGVTSATINQRVNAIDGFSWSQRHEFVETLFDGESDFEDDGTLEEPDRVNSEPPSDPVLDRNGNTDGGEDVEAETRLDDRPSERPTRSKSAEAPPQNSEFLERLGEQVAQLTHRLEAVEETVGTEPASGSGVLSDPELTHKVLHACLTADHISEEEELCILKAVTASESGST